MAHIQLRINYEEKEAAQEVLDSLGLTMSGAIKLFLKQVVREQGLPFTVTKQSAAIKNNVPEINKKESDSVTEKIQSVNEIGGFSVRKIG